MQADFSILYQKPENAFFQIWPGIARKIILLAKKKASNEEIKTILNQNKDCILLMVNYSSKMFYF